VSAAEARIEPTVTADNACNRRFSLISLRVRARGVGKEGEQEFGGKKGKNRMENSTGGNLFRISEILDSPFLSRREC
jgi:hypothetical protein